MYQQWQYLKLKDGRLVDESTGVEANIHWPLFLSCEAAEQYLMDNNIRATVESEDEDEESHEGLWSMIAKSKESHMEYGYPNLAYPVPSSVSEALEQSMAEETLAANWYRQRAAFARSPEGGFDEITAKLWDDIAEEEEGHYTRFKNRRDEAGYR